jgi:hypothetical protein
MEQGGAARVPPLQVLVIEDCDAVRLEEELEERVEREEGVERVERVEKVEGVERDERDESEREWRVEGGERLPELTCALVFRKSM